MHARDHATRPLGVGVNRRDFLRAGGAGAAGYLALAGPARLPAGTLRDEQAVIFLMLTGGPSQLDTWDPKPDAPAEIRGPFESIATRVPGVRLSAHLPRSAARLDRLTLVRSMHHDAAPIHETGHQLVQTGRLASLGDEPPHVGAVVSQMRGSRKGVPANVLLPGPIGNTGFGVGHGQRAGWLGKEHEPVSPDSSKSLSSLCDLADEPDRTVSAYGSSSFGRNCLRARRLVEAGTRFVTVNMFDTVFRPGTWDCHGAAPFSTLADYATDVLPDFDRGFNAMLDDLEARGRLETTLVVATGEFGRTPRLNAFGGRDHWPGVWTAVLAGGGTRGGQVIGASDHDGAYPVDRPVNPADLVATIYRFLGLERSPVEFTAAGGWPLPGLDAGTPLRELFG